MRETKDHVLDKVEGIISRLPEQLRKEVSYWDVLDAAIDIAGTDFIKVRLEREGERERRARIIRKRMRK